MFQRGMAKWLQPLSGPVWGTWHAQSAQQQGNRGPCKPVPHGNREIGRKAVVPAYGVAGRLLMGRGVKEGLSCVVLGMVLAMPSCDQSSDSAKLPAKRCVALQIDDPMPAFDVYFTWSNYDARAGDESEAHYIWNGTDIGVGRAGCERLFAQVRGLPFGTRVLVYPSYELFWQADCGPRDYPFPILELLAIVRDRGLWLFLSPWDHRGRMHPECIRPRIHSAPSTATSSAPS